MEVTRLGHSSPYMCLEKKKIPLKTTPIIHFKKTYIMTEKIAKSEEQLLIELDLLHIGIFT
ncbi:hypothetical protein Bca4012_093539 [Brassica carinata]|uniref:Uncharacterized protein n=2 Tax=Brassica TaxID=3705 RepID=A0A0D3DN36_BRAOL|nr:unnamed protein product [Brassica napus]CDY68024.1 BnaCnng57340D [Brassica napus]